MAMEIAEETEEVVIRPNIKIQKTGAEEVCNAQVHSPASDLGRWEGKGHHCMHAIRSCRDSL